MKGKTTHVKLLGAGLALALALSAPAAAHGTSAGGEGRARAVRNTDYAQGAAVLLARASGPVRLRQIENAGARTAERAATVTTQSGLGWREAAIGAGIVIGILLLGLWGDVAVGAAIVGAAALPARQRRSSRGDRGVTVPGPRWAGGPGGSRDSGERHGRRRGRSGNERSSTGSAEARNKLLSRARPMVYEAAP